MIFCEARRLLLEGRMVRRDGWAGKDVYLFMVESTEWEFTTDIEDHQINEARTTGFIAMRTSLNEVAPWNPNQNDIMSSDWLEYFP